MGMNEMIQFFRQISGKLNSNIYAGIQGPPTAQRMAFIRELQKEVKKNKDLDIPLHALKTVVFDLETTGFFPDKGHRVISIGAIKMTGQKIGDHETFYSLIKSDLSLPEEISALTNIRGEELQCAPPASEVLLDFFKFIGSDILVAHHSKHEESFMKKMTWDLLKTKFEHRIIDTSFLIRLSNPSVKSLPLEEVCRECAIEVCNRHHALGDAILTAKIWSHYLKEAEAKGFKSLIEIYEYLSKLR